MGTARANELYNIRRSRQDPVGTFHYLIELSDAYLKTRTMNPGNRGKSGVYLGFSPIPEASNFIHYRYSYCTTSMEDF